MTSGAAAALLLYCAGTVAAEAPEPPPPEPVDPWGDDTPWPGDAWLDSDWPSATTTYTVKPAIPPDVDVDDAPDLSSSTRRSPLAWSDDFSTHCPFRDRDPDHRLQPELSLGWTSGDYHAGVVTGSVSGFRVTAGLRRHRWALLADYGLLAFAEITQSREPRHAIVHRAGGLARYSFGVVSLGDPTARGDFWIEAGAAREFLRWDLGGRLARTDVSVGFGGQGTLRFGENNRKKLGLSLGVKVMVARRPPDKQFPPTCAGPCDASTRVTSYDVMYLVDVGIPFGR